MSFCRSFRETSHLIAIICLINCIIVLNAKADSKSNSILLPAPQNLSIYNLPPNQLTDRDVWTIKIHGIRLTPLDPTVWSPLRIDRTDNRHLIPIRRFFLRESEKPGFKVTSIAADFRFKAASDKSMEKFPHERDPVFEIAFGGKYSNHKLSNTPEEDSGYAIRLSGFEPIQSGLFHYAQSHYQALPNISLPNLDTSSTYKILLEFKDDKVGVRLNEKDVGSFSADGLAAGLVSLQASWHPVLINKLDIRGTEKGNTDAVTYSGLIPNPDFARKKE